MLIEVLIIRSKLQLVNYAFNESDDLLRQSYELAEEKGYHRLMEIIKQEKIKFDENLENGRF